MAEQKPQVPTSDANYQAYDHKVMQQQATEGNDPGIAGDIAAGWKEIADDWVDISIQFKTMTEGSESMWSGTAAEGARSNFTAFAESTNTLGQQHHTAGDVVQTQTSAAETAKSTMPAPVPYEPGKMLKEAAGSGNPFNMVSLLWEMPAQKEKSDNAKDEAVQVMQTRDTTFASSASSIAAFTELPKGPGPGPTPPPPPPPPYPPTPPPIGPPPHAEFPPGGGGDRNGPGKVGTSRIGTGIGTGIGIYERQPPPLPPNQGKDQGKTLNEKVTNKSEVKPPPGRVVPPGQIQPPGSRPPGPPPNLPGIPPGGGGRFGGPGGGGGAGSGRGGGPGGSPGGRGFGPGGSGSGFGPTGSGSAGGPGAGGRSGMLPTGTGPGGPGAAGMGPGAMGAGGRGGAGAAGMGAGMGAGAAKGGGDEDKEHKSADYLVETEDVFGNGEMVAPPVIGE